MSAALFSLFTFIASVVIDAVSILGLVNSNGNMLKIILFTAVNIAISGFLYWQVDMFIKVRNKTRETLRKMREMEEQMKKEGKKL